MRPFIPAVGITSLALVARLVTAHAADAAAPPEERLLDLQRSTVMLRVTIEGLGRVFAPAEILIHAPLSEGAVQPAVPHLQVVFDARQLRVAEGGLPASDREAVQARLTGPEVLDVGRFSRVSYHSVTIERRAVDWLINGELELHGTILPLQATARQEGDRYVGRAWVRPSAFGVPLVTRWGGLLRVKDEVAVEFDVMLATGRPG